MGSGIQKLLGQDQAKWESIGHLLVLGRKILAEDFTAGDVQMPSWWGDSEDTVNLDPGTEPAYSMNCIHLHVTY